MTHDQLSPQRIRPEANRETSTERTVVEAIMQPFMGNRDWANMVAPKSAPEPAGAVAVAAGEPWLAGEAYMTASFLTGLQ